MIRRAAARSALSFCAIAIAASALALPHADAAELQAGAGRADITPPTGFAMFGWVRSDARSQGQHTRLFARAIVLNDGGRKLALVSVDLGAISAGLIADAASRVAGFSHRNVIVSASHTHSAPTGYFNFPAFNTVAPTDTTPADFSLAPPADRQLYTFLSRRIAAAIRRADRDLGPAAAAWGSTRLLHTTENRSIEAHLANHGLELDVGEGEVSLDPGGYPHTIDPLVSVLRVDKLLGGRLVPIGMWSTFANHGTVVKHTFPYYNADHHAAAALVAEARIRMLGDVPRGQTVVHAYGNSDGGDITAGLEHSGPAGADEVGREEARAMLRAWRRAGARLERDPVLALRWTRACFCGAETAEGPVADHGVVGLPFLTGSDEHRGPLYDETGIPFEGLRLPVALEPQGVKIPATTGGLPKAISLSVVRVGARLIVTVPGEASEGMGRRLRAAVLAATREAGIRSVVLSGLAGDYMHYLTTPEEYGRQHYEGGATLFGPYTGVFVEERLADLAVRLVTHRRAPAPYPYDPSNGVIANGSPYGRGSERGRATAQPEPTRRLGHAVFEWTGGPRGLDRPLDRAFVTVQRREDGAWRRVDSDLGLRILWEVDAEDRYRATWEPGLGAPLGRYRFVVSGRRYLLSSDTFRLRPSRALGGKVIRSRPGRVVLALLNPAAIENRDLTWRPRRARISAVRLAGGATEAVEIVIDNGRAVITAPPGTTVTIPKGGMRDPNGNRNGAALELDL